MSVRPERLRRKDAEARAGFRGLVEGQRLRRAVSLVGPPKVVIREVSLPVAVIRQGIPHGVFIGHLELPRPDDLVENSKDLRLTEVVSGLQNSHELAQDHGLYEHLLVFCGRSLDRRARHRRLFRFILREVADKDVRAESPYRRPLGSRIT